jgi:hypothetical protein
MKDKRLDPVRIIKEIAGASDEALDCRQAQSQLPAVVDTAISGQDVSHHFPKIVAHMQLCNQCRQDYEDLLEVTQMAAEGRLPAPEQIPVFERQEIQQRLRPPQDRFLVEFRQYLETLAADTRKASQDALEKLMREGANVLGLLLVPAEPVLERAPVRAQFESRQFTYQVEALGLEITLKLREFDRHRFTVRGLIGHDVAWDKMGVCLLALENEELDCTKVDEANTFTFHNVPPGQYRIRFDLTTEETLYLDGLIF